MLEEDIDDTHFCCKCSSTIVGLENYVQHRKNNCTAKSSRSITQVDHPYGAFDFSENISYPIKNDEVEKGSKCLSYTYDLPYELGADVFFSSLELQSSSKRVLPSSSSLPASEKSSSYKVAPRKHTEALLSTQEHDDEWIESGNNSDNLIKAVNSISGNKKFDSPFKLLTFQHDSPDASDVEVDDEDDYEAAAPAVPASHTGGKWKPENEPETDRLQWDSPERGDEKTAKVEEQDEFEHDLNPPPEHTKGKWVPGTTFSKILNKRQLKPSFEPSKSGKLYQTNTVSKRPKCTQQIQISPPNQKQGKQTKTFNENIVPKYKSPSKYKSNKYKQNHIKCEVCNLYLQKHSMGLHLISHQHYRKGIQKPTKSFETILENIHQIVKESPFQCQPCHFYANREKQFLSHWDSVGHITAINGPGLLWCNFCKFECLKNCDMKEHLIGSEHKEVMNAFNHTIPIIIRKKTLITCSKCKKIFHYNIQLKRHTCRMAVVNDTESKFRCKKCGKSFKNRLALQRHQFRQHKEHSYFCSTCEMEFETHKDKRKHNNSAVHKINFAILKKMEMPVRQCKVCGATCSDILELKEHIKAQHPETKSLCRFCGKGFELPQDLTYHVRYKICQEKLSLSDKKVTSSNLLLTALTRSSEISTFKDQTYCNFDPKSRNVSDDSHEIHAENQLDTQYKCKECKYSTKVKAELIFHELMHSLPDIKPEDKMTCPRCNKKFSQKSLRFHLRGHTDEKAYVCKLCFAKFAMRQHLVQHTLRVHNNYGTKSSNHRRTPSFLCGTCGRVFKKKADQGNSTIDNVEGEKLCCPSCSQKSYKATFFKCNLCPASFVRKHNFIEHQKSTHHHEKNETPRTSNKDKDICEDFIEKSPSQSGSTAHCSKQVEISSSEQYSTDISQVNLPRCSGESKYSAHLTNSIKFEDGEDYDKGNEIDESILHLSRHQCDTCGKVFQKKYNLRQHITIHGKRDEQFSCPAENCIFVGRNASDLKTHMEVHSAEKTYSCDFEGCDYKGKTIRNLRRHAKIHSTEEEFKYFCPSCEFKTRLPGHIKRHMRIHTGEKPYKCPYCDYACSNSENLRKHVITTSVHPGRSLYECKLCDERALTFKTNYYKEYKAHLNNDHQIKPKADVGPSKE